MVDRICIDRERERGVKDESQSTDCLLAGCLMMTSLEVVTLKKHHVCMKTILHLYLNTYRAQELEEFNELLYSKLVVTKI